MHKLLLHTVLISLYITNCQDDPFIQFPVLQKPHYITYTNTLSDGNILSAYKEHSTKLQGLEIQVPELQIRDPYFIRQSPGTIYGDILHVINSLNSFLRPGKSINYVQVLIGQALHDYNPQGALKGFYLQDAQAAILIKTHYPNPIERGDTIKTTISTFQRKSCSKCTKKGGLPQLQAIAQTVAIQNKSKTIYCKEVHTPFPSGNPNGPQCVKITGTVSHKSSSSAAIWGMDANTWAIFITNPTERDFPNVRVGDRIIAYGVFDAYPYSLAGGIIQNPYPLHVFHAKESIINTSKAHTETLIGTVINDYDAQKSGNYFNGFFLQDRNATIFIKITDPHSNIRVSRGNRIKLHAREYQESSSGQLFIKNPRHTDIQILSRGHKILCRPFSHYKNTPPTQRIPQFIELEAQVTHKSSDDSATWGLNGNSIILRIPIESERNFPNIYPGDKILVYGILDKYDGQSTISNPHSNTIWVYDAHRSIIDLTEPYSNK